MADIFGSGVNGSNVIIGAGGDGDGDGDGVAAPSSLIFFTTIVSMSVPRVCNKFEKFLSAPFVLR